MVPDDTNLDDSEDPSAEVVDIDDELTRAGKKGDGDKGPSIIGEGGEETIIQPDEPDSDPDA